MVFSGKHTSLLRRRMEHVTTKNSKLGTITYLQSTDCFKLSMNGLYWQWFPVENTLAYYGEIAKDRTSYDKVFKIGYYHLIQASDWFNFIS